MSYKERKNKYIIAVTSLVTEELRVDENLLRNKRTFGSETYEFRIIDNDTFTDYDNDRFPSEYDAVVFHRRVDDIEEHEEFKNKFKGDKLNRIPMFRLNEYLSMVVASRHFSVPSFFHPKYYGEFLEFLEVGKKYVIKAYDMARGLGKMHIDPEDFNHMRMLRSFYTGGHKKATPLITPPHPSALNYPEENEECSESNLKPSTSFVMEDIGYENIREFRVILFKTKAYCLKERFGYHPLSGGNREDVPLYSVDPTIFPNDDMELIINKFYNILKDGGTPYASFDLYVKVDETEFDKRYGIFEWSNQFAFSFPLSVIKQIRDHYTISLAEHILENVGYEPSRDWDEVVPFLLKGRKAD